MLPRREWNLCHFRSPPGRHGAEVRLRFHTLDAALGGLLFMVKAAVQEDDPLVISRSVPFAAVALSAHVRSFTASSTPFRMTTGAGAGLRTQILCKTTAAVPASVFRKLSSVCPDVGIFRLRGPTHFVRRPASLKMTGVLDAPSARVELVPFPVSLNKTRELRPTPISYARRSL